MYSFAVEKGACCPYHYYDYGESDYHDKEHIAVVTKLVIVHHGYSYDDGDEVSAGGDSPIMFKLMELVIVLIMVIRTHGSDAGADEGE